VCKKLVGVFSVPNNNSRNGAQRNDGGQALNAVITLRFIPDVVSNTNFILHTRVLVYSPSQLR